MTASYERHNPRGYQGDPKRGASLGRPDRHLPERWRPTFEGQLTLQKIRINADGYDRLGTYWGISDACCLYWAGSDDGAIDITCWARSREQARMLVLSLYPNAKVRK